VASVLLKTSALSGRRAEPEHFGLCEFTGTEVLNTELAKSGFSGKRYRIDEMARSSVSGRMGHKSEFVTCHQTGQLLARSEAERCEATGNYVLPGILQQCGMTRKQVLPSELLRCSTTGKKALRRFFVLSSLSGACVLESVAVRSSRGEFCTAREAKPCSWSGLRSHPDDLRVCELTGLPIHFRFTPRSVAGKGRNRLQPLAELLDGTRRSAEAPRLWNAVAARAREAIGKGRCRVEAAILSPDGQLLAVCLEVRTLLGLRRQTAGLIFDIGRRSVLGRVALGRRGPRGWVPQGS